MGGGRHHCTIRPVREEDAARIVKLLNPIIRAGRYTAMTEEATTEDQLEFIRGLPERGVYHAAEKSGEILGIQDVMPAAEGWPVGEVSTFVALTAHRRGVGRSLAGATLGAVKALGFEVLRATIRADNPQALAFYQSLGFEVSRADSKEVVTEMLI